MKHWLLVVCLAAAVCLGLPSIAGASAVEPTIVLEENCYVA